MARIRTIKPDFFTSPDTAKVDFPVRIFYAALWCWADDFGVGETNLNGLLGHAFPDSDGFTAQDVRHFCADCAQHFGVTFYQVRGRAYFAIPSWEKHQKMESREDRRKYPPPTDPDAVPDLRFQPRADFAPEVRRKTGADSALEEGRRKKEEGRGELPCATKLRETTTSPRFDEFWQTYPRRRDRRKAEKAFTNALKRTDPDTLIAGALRYAQDPNRVEEFTKYAEGWLNGDGWLDEPLPVRRANGHRLSTTDQICADLQARKIPPSQPQRLEIE